MNPRFESIKPVRENHVFNNNARITPSGGSDFWESGALYPDRTLKDMIRILHPELLPDHELFFYVQNRCRVVKIKDGVRTIGCIVRCGTIAVHIHELI